MDADTYYELERDAASDMGMSYAEYANGDASLEWIAKRKAELEAAKNCDLTWNCPCPRCNGKSLNEEVTTEKEWVKTYVEDDEELMAMLSADGVKF